MVNQFEVLIVPIREKYSKMEKVQAKKLGVAHLLPSHEGYYAIQEQYREEYHALRAALASEATRDTSERLCRDCEKPLVKKPGRGRWPVKCPECR